MASPIVISILANANQANRQLKETAGLTSRVGGGFKKMAIPVVAGLGALAVVGKEVVTSASNAQQSIGATQSVFGKYANDVIDKSNKAANAVGLSANEYRELSTVMGAMLKNAGTPMDQLGGKTDKLVTLGSDLAATFGGTTKEAVSALSSLMRGEADPIERYGVSIKQSDVNARLAAKGQDKLTGAALKNAEAQARLDLLYKQTGDAQGQFGRESNTFAGQQQRLAAQFDNLKVAIGSRLLPVLTTVLTYINTNGPRIAAVFMNAVGFVKGFFDRFSSGSGEAGARFAQFRTTFMSVWANIQSIFTSAVSIVLSLWRRFGSTLTSFMGSSLKNMLTIVKGVFNLLAGIFKTIAAVLKGDWRGAWNGIKQIVTGAMGIIKGVVSQGMNLIKTIFKLAWSALKGIVSGAWNAAKSAVSSGVSGVVGLVRALPGKIKGALGSLGSLLLGIGSDIVSGLANGIRNGIGRVMDAARSLADAIPGPIRKALGIASPSKVAKRLGRFVSQGLAIGILDGGRSVDRAVIKLNKSLNRRIARVPRNATKAQRRAVRKANQKRLADIRKNTKAVGAALLKEARTELAARKKVRSDYAKAVRDSARQFAALSGITAGENETLSASTITQGLRDRLAAIKNFNTKLKALQKAGLSKDLYNQIVQMGVENGTAYAEALTAGGPAAIKEANSLQSQINSAASSLGNSTADAMYKAGVDSAAGYVRGLESLVRKINKSGTKIAASLVRSLKKALGIRSPSRVFKGIGQDTIAGLNIGLDERAVRAQGAMLGASLQRGFRSPELDAQLIAGFNASNTKSTGNTYNVTVQVTDSMSKEQQGKKFSDAIKAAEKAGMIRR